MKITPNFYGPKYTLSLIFISAFFFFFFIFSFSFIWKAVTKWNQFHPHYMHYLSTYHPSKMGISKLKWKSLHLQLEIYMFYKTQ